jgi:hypothetical protein
MQVTFLTKVVPLGPLASEKKIEWRIDEGEIIDIQNDDDNKLSLNSKWPITNARGSHLKRCHTKLEIILARGSHLKGAIPSLEITLVNLLFQIPTLLHSLFFTRHIKLL